jgi:hypothetical protein
MFHRPQGIGSVMFQTSSLGEYISDRKLWRMLCLRPQAMERVMFQTASYRVIFHRSQAMENMFHRPQAMESVMFQTSGFVECDVSDRMLLRMLFSDRKPRRE